MMQESNFRDQIIEALKKDLVGPLIDPNSSYPGSQVHIVEENATFDSKYVLNKVFQSTSGQEILIAAPTSRYGIGTLYPPRLNTGVEKTLEEEQALVLEGQNLDENEPETKTNPSDLIEPTDDKEEVSEEAPIVRAPRPSALGFSFVILKKAKSVEIRIKGGRYEPFMVWVGGTSNKWWRRIEIVSDPIRFDNPFSNETKKLSQQISYGSIKLEIGVVFNRSKPSDPKQIVTCYLRNISTDSSLDDLSRFVVFQTYLEAKIPRGTLQEYPQSLGPPDKEDLSLKLLYSKHPIYAIGHGCGAKVENSFENTIIKSEILPQASVSAIGFNIEDKKGNAIELGMESLSRWDSHTIIGIESMIASYKSWIEEQKTKTIKDDFKQIASDHIQECEKFSRDIDEGWELVKNDTSVRRCFQWINQAMAFQQLAYQAKTRQIVNGDVKGQEPTQTTSNRPPAWRGFQLGFLLANLTSIVDKNHPNSKLVDVIWIPTGGGKTEAYLAVAGFVILWQRLNSENKKNDGTAVLMRYTLRLLTAQQLQRVASLICALEVLRSQEKESLGTKRFVVGAWLGSTSSPNSRKDAIKRLKDFKNSRRSAELPFLLNRCPWCATTLLDSSQKGQRNYGYQEQTTNGISRVQPFCLNPNCKFSTIGIPVYEVDEDIYKRPPSFLLGTVDKFAQLSWRSDVRSIFGIDKQGNRERPAPGLIIQDELHLITGPLGSLVGLYEAAIRILCEHDGGSSPKILAATATTRAYKKQIEGVFSRKTSRLVPPPGIDIGDSYFAHTDVKKPPRKYLGICSTGIPQFSRIQMRTIASVAHAVGSLRKDPNDNLSNYYWTNLVFFGSLRDLGSAKSLLATDLKGQQWNLYRYTSTHSGKNNEALTSYRNLYNTIELTSASTQSASDSLEKLQYSSIDKKCIDIALATSVIEVGVDVSRLGLLTIVHQPKTAASYIQVSGRVGRDEQGPGLVLVLLSPSVSRDISHYERFISYHDRLYESVEPASVTPFTDASLDRGLRSVVAAIVRQIKKEENIDQITQEDIESAQKAIDNIIKNAPLEAEAKITTTWRPALAELEKAFEQNLTWGSAKDKNSNQFLRTLDSKPPNTRTTWPVLNSLRNVDSMVGVQISDRWISLLPLPDLRMPSQIDPSEKIYSGDDW